MSAGVQREIYDRHFGSRGEPTRGQASHPMLGEFYDRVAGRALDSLPGSPDTVRLLEVGCGGGLLASALQRVAARRDITLRYTGSDVSSEAVRLAATLVPAEYDVGDAQTVGDRLPHDSFDLVIAKNLLHHLTDPAGFLAGASRLVDGPGRVVAAEASLGSPQAWLFSVLAPRRERLFFVSNRRRNHRAFADAGLRLYADEPFSWLPYELLLATRFDLPRRLLAWPPERVAALSRLDDVLARKVTSLAAYRIYVGAPPA